MGLVIRPSVPGGRTSNCVQDCNKTHRTKFSGTGGQKTSGLEHRCGNWCARVISGVLPGTGGDYNELPTTSAHWRRTCVYFGAWGRLTPPPIIVSCPFRRRTGGERVHFVAWGKPIPPPNPHPGVSQFANTVHSSFNNIDLTNTNTNSLRM